MTFPKQEGKKLLQTEIQAVKTEMIGLFWHWDETFVK